MRAEILAIGTELLLAGRRDGNGDWLTARLAEAGADVARRAIVADDEGEIAEAFSQARARARIIVATGGLGPTKDDLTREALARSLGAPLEVDAAVHARLTAAYSARGAVGRTSAERQARIPRGCAIIDNPVGSAPGILHAGPPCWTIVLPGVPREMEAMFPAAIARIAGALPAGAPPVARLLAAGAGESEVDERLSDLIGAHARARVTILAGETGVELLIVGTGDDRAAAQEEVARIAAVARDRLGDWIVGEGDVTLPGAVGELLRARGGRLAVAESCTGGMLGALVTETAGSSAWFAGGFIVYESRLKEELLGVPRATLDAHGAVSEETAAAMAEGARVRAGATHALAVTGIAGPGGGTSSKPVGLVWIAVADGEGAHARSLHLRGDRATIRRRAAALALDALRRRLLRTRP